MQSQDSMLRGFAPTGIIFTESDTFPRDIQLEGQFRRRCECAFTLFSANGSTSQESCKVTEDSCTSFHMLPANSVCLWCLGFGRIFTYLQKRPFHYQSMDQIKPSLLATTEPPVRPPQVSIDSNKHKKQPNKTSSKGHQILYLNQKFLEDYSYCGGTKPNSDKEREKLFCLLTLHRDSLSACPICRKGDKSQSKVLTRRPLKSTIFPHFNYKENLHQYLHRRCFNIKTNVLWK